MALGSPILNSSCDGNLGVLLESLQGQRDLIEACVQDLIFLSREDRDPGFPFQTPPGSQDSPGGEAKDSAFLSSRNTDLLEPTEWKHKHKMHHGEFYYLITSALYGTTVSESKHTIDAQKVLAE